MNARFSQMLNRASHKSIWIIFAQLLFVNGLTSAHALMLDWDTLTWSPEGGSNLSQTYDIGGSDVVVTFSGNIAGLVQTVNASPAVNDLNTGGLTSPEQSLYLATDYANNDNPQITVTFDFSDYAGGISDVSFSIFDLDASASFTDEVMITAIANGVLVDPTTLLTSSANELLNSNTATGIAPAPPGSADANLWVSFEQIGITELQIVYRNTTEFVPNLQHINIHDISYSAVPLPGAMVLFGSGLCGLLFARRRQNL